MKDLTLRNIAKACGGELHLYNRGQEKAEVNGVVIDSRKIEAGNLFVATRGERVDGHSFIPQVWEKGALCVICEEDLADSAFVPEGIRGNYIVVKSSFQALKDLAKFYRSVLKITVVGVTGSVGKTSTKEMIATVLSKRFNVQKTAGNFNNEVGLPLSIFSLREEHEVAVLEMGISDFGEMTRLSEIAKPDHVVITNIGPCHLEFLGDLDGVLRAKTEIFQNRNPKGAVILNGNDEKLRTIIDVNGTKPVYFGSCHNDEEKRAQKEGTAVRQLDIFATDIVSFGLEGTGCMVHTPKGDFPVRVPLPGIHMVDNALAATAVGLTLGMDISLIRDGISAVEGLSGRSHLIHTQDYLLVDDCYNANPKAMRAAIDLIRNAQGRKVAILGDMFELGEGSEEMHASVGEYARDKVDVLICCGTLSKHMYEAAKGGEQKTFWFETLEELIAEIRRERQLKAAPIDWSKAPEQTMGLLEEDDTILIKASHGMGFSKLLDALQEAVDETEG
ncbi:MAG: UDP-N-acetylmuramoyl-tripeptide--D-alanyl-D-alanine ligase [Lachnospiraceae bacterium]|nr:UDP-N-acetylmuramoyl-tripeptide--D-alanyl-D-alanine ligase [Lachnospiraceae bacterium]